MKLFRAFAGRNEDGELKEAIRTGAFLVDVRGEAEFLGGSVPGAVNIPLVSLPGKIGELAGKSRVVVFCASGGRSLQAKVILEQNGIDNVINGGGWQNVMRCLNS